MSNEFNKSIRRNLAVYINTYKKLKFIAKYEDDLMRKTLDKVVDLYIEKRNIPLPAELRPANHDEVEALKHIEDQPQF